MIAVRGDNNGMRGEAINNQADKMEENRDTIGGVKSSIKTSRATFTRSIKGSEVPNISSRSPKGSYRVERFNGGKETSGILNSLSCVEITRGWGEASGSMFIYIIAFTR